MFITEEQLVLRGFVKKQSSFGAYYVLDNFGVVKNFKWQVCNCHTGRPLSTLLYVETMEELEKQISDSSHNQ